MKKPQQQDPLRELVREAGLEEPSAEFSTRLAHQVVTSHAYRERSVKMHIPDLAGKVIIGVLITLNGLILLKLNPFNSQPVLCWSISGFILAFFCILRWIKKVTEKNIYQ